MLECEKTKLFFTPPDQELVPGYYDDFVELLDFYGIQIDMKESHLPGIKSTLFPIKTLQHNAYFKLQQACDDFFSKGLITNVRDKNDLVAVLRFLLEDHLEHVCIGALYINFTIHASANNNAFEVFCYKAKRFFKTLMKGMK